MGGGGILLRAGQVPGMTPLAVTDCGVRVSTGDPTGLAAVAVVGGAWVGTWLVLRGCLGNAKGLDMRGQHKRPHHPRRGKDGGSSRARFPGGAPQALGQKAQDVRPGSRRVPGRSRYQTHSRGPVREGELFEVWTCPPGQRRGGARWFAWRRGKEQLEGREGPRWRPGSFEPEMSG